MQRFAAYVLLALLPQLSLAATEETRLACYRSMVAEGIRTVAERFDFAMAESLETTVGRVIQKKFYEQDNYEDDVFYLRQPRFGTDVLRLIGSVDFYKSKESRLPLSVNLRDNLSPRDLEQIKVSNAMKSCLEAKVLEAFYSRSE